MIVIFLYLFYCSFPLIYTNIPRFRVNLCPSVGLIFPLISLICTDILRFRVNPCSSVVGIISHRETSFRGCISDHWTSLNLTEQRMYISCFRVYLCPSVGILISLRKRNLGAKVQQKMHICKKIARKFTFRCDLLWFLVISIQKYAALRLLQKYSKITGHCLRLYKLCKGYYLQQHKQHKSTTIRWGTTHPSGKGYCFKTIYVN